MTNIIMFDSRHSVEDLGLLPMFLDADDPRPAREQLDSNYQHGGGFRPMPGFTLDFLTGSLSYPGDSVMAPIAATVIHGEAVLFYPYAFVMILQHDNSFEIARLD